MRVLGRCRTSFYKVKCRAICTGVRNCIGRKFLRGSSIYAVLFNFLACLCILSVADSARAHHPDKGAPEEESAVRYLDEIAGRRIQARVQHLGKDDLVARTEEPEPEATNKPSPSGRSDVTRYVIIAVLVAMLVSVAIAVFRFGGGAGVAFSGRVKDQTLDEGGTSDFVALAETAGEDDILARVASMADPRAALHELTVMSLARAIRDTGIRPAPGWTARDVIRALPQQWVHRGVVSDVTRTAELSWFGGRHVDSETLSEAIERLRPLLSPLPRTGRSA